MNSCIYEGYVRHRRFRPVQNAFQYRLFLMFLDLAELPTIFEDRLLWSGDQVNLAYFRRKDHLGDSKVPLEQAVRDLVEERVGRRTTGPIRLLTHLRYFGYCFNPVSLYYCYDQADQHVETIVAEIHNTPWGEEYCYVLGEDLNERAPRKRMEALSARQKFSYFTLYGYGDSLRLEISRARAIIKCAYDKPPRRYEVV